MIRKLIVGNGRSEREVLVVSNLLVGRDPACHISEPDPLLSRRHAEILAGTHGVSVRDLDSRNGVLVNGEKTREQVLFPGDVVQMGHLLLRYVEEVSDAEPVERRRDRRARHQPTMRHRSRRRSIASRLNRMRRVVGERSPRQCPAAARPRTKRRLRA
ncbi:MAG: FHA domain-containing protein [Vicinamibacterales bacterium]